MARSRSRRGGAPPRQARATSRKKAPVVTSKVEVVEEVQGLGMEDAVAIVTALLLFIGILFLDYELASHYDPHGVFF